MVVDVLAAMNAKLSVAGTDGVDYNSLGYVCYWSSSEYAGDGSAFRIDLIIAVSAIRTSSSKNAELLVRPFLAF